MALNFTLNTRVLREQATAVGQDIYEGGDLHDNNNRLVGTFAILNQTINTVTDVHGLDTAMVTMTLFFFAGQAPHPHGGAGAGGGGGGGHPQARQCPENITLLGANEFEGQAGKGGQGGQAGQARATARACGSVAAASQQFASNIGKQFTRIGDKLTIV